MLNTIGGNKASDMMIMSVEFFMRVVFEDEPLPYQYQIQSDGSIHRLLSP